MVNTQLKLGISAMIDMNVSEKNINFTYEMSNYLSENIDISIYGTKFQQIGLIFMAMNPTTPSFRPDKKINRWKHKVFDMYINVPDYEKFRTATKTEARKIIAELYLTGIKKYLSKQKDFNHKLFYKDVKKLFINKGIL